jgi:hypothetical protein
MRNESTKKEGHDPSIFWLATNWNLSSKALVEGITKVEPALGFSIALCTFILLHKIFWQMWAIFFLS